MCEELIQIKPIVFFATHFQDLAHTLEVYHNVVNMHLETEVNRIQIRLSAIWTCCVCAQTRLTESFYASACQLKRDDEQNPGLNFKYRVSQGFANEEHYGKVHRSVTLEPGSGMGTDFVFMDD